MVEIGVPQGLSVYYWAEQGFLAAWALTMFLLFALLIRREVGQNAVCFVVVCALMWCAVISVRMVLLVLLGRPHLWGGRFIVWVQQPRF